MEIFTIVLSSLLAVISPAGVIVDQVVAAEIRSRVKGVEQLAVRIDNVPSYQLVNGKVDRIRIASRGIQPVENFRIDTFELESAPIDVNLQVLQQGGINALRDSLRHPLQGGMRLVLTESDLNQALQSPNIKAKIQQLINNLLPKEEDIEVKSFELLDTRLDFMGNNRFGVAVKLQQNSSSSEKPPETLELWLEVTIKVIAGRSVQLLNPSGTLNGRKLSTRLLNGFAEGLSEDLDLRSLEKQGITARLLQFEITEDEFDLAAFISLKENK
jgi:hypothetical protein